MCRQRLDSKETHQSEKEIRDVCEHMMVPDDFLLIIVMYDVFVHKFSPSSPASTNAVS